MSSDTRRHELLARLDHLHDRVADAVVRSAPSADGPDHPLRGLFLSHDQALDLLDPDESRWDDSRSDDTRWDGPSSDDPRWHDVPDERPQLATNLSAIAARGGLDVVDIDILVCALAPDIDPRYERLYGFVHDDLTMRRASIGLAMQVCGLSPASSDRARFDPTGPLIANALLVVDDESRPYLARTLRVPDHVTAFLLGSTDVEPVLRPFVVEPVLVGTDDVEPVRQAVDRNDVVHLTDGAGAAAAHIAATAVRAAGSVPLVIDLAAVRPDSIDAVLAAAIRHRILTGDVLVVRTIAAAAERARARLGRLVDGGGPLVLIGSTPWDPAWTDRIPHRLAAAELTEIETSRIWRSALGEVDVADDAIEMARSSFRLTPEQITRAARAVTLDARSTGRSVAFADLSAAARAQSASGLDRLARRLQPSVTWADLILPGEVTDLLRELTERVRWRDQVMNDWGLGRGWRNQGIAALFAGPSGTGKTTAAEVLAGELGYDIHVVDLSSVVDKYIGETEKKLEVIFTEAERTNTVLLFDEADAIFGKRSEVKDARDRYANIEVSYLLQRIERFSGLAVLTTNLGANLDEAFTRRLDAVVDFPRPDVAARERLWRHELRPGLPTSGIDVEFCAAAFELTGGNIRNIVITAAYLAAEARTSVSMVEIVIAVQREYRKMGRLCLASEFGPYGDLLRSIG